jgi:hypothetical protein
VSSRCLAFFNNSKAMKKWITENILLLAAILLVAGAIVCSMNTDQALDYWLGQPISSISRFEFLFYYVLMLVYLR